MTMTTPPAGVLPAPAACLLKRLAAASGVPGEEAVRQFAGVAAGALDGRPRGGPRRSTLAPAGVPFEVSVELGRGVASPALRYNVDPGDQRLVPAQRAAVVRAAIGEALAGRPTHRRANLDLFDRLALRRSPDARFTAWLGVVQAAGSDTRVRVYHNLRGRPGAPEGDGFRGPVQPAWTSPLGEARAVIFAVESSLAHLGVRTYHSHHAAMDRSAVRSLDRRAGRLRGPLAEFLAVVAPGGLPERALLSYVPDDDPEGINAYVPLSRTCVDDARARDRVLQLCASFATDPDPYLRMLEILPPRPGAGGVDRHGYLGIGPGPRLKVYLRVHWSELGR